MQIGTVIASNRKLKGFSQGELATEVGVSQTYMSQIERNKKEPAISLLNKIAEAIGIPVPVLFFLSLEDKDVPASKKSIFKEEYPKLKETVKSFFDGNTQS